jgi:hypothetical protein
MRIYEGNYAYEIEQVLDPATKIGSGWRYNIYRVRPRDELLRSGQAETKDAAKQADRLRVSRLLLTANSMSSTALNVLFTRLRPGAHIAAAK